MAEMDAFERRVAGTLLHYADDVSVAVDAAAVAHRVALEHPRRRVGVLPWRLAAIPRVAWVLLLLAALITAMVAGMLVVGSQPVRKLQAVVPAFNCPPGSTPDAPGPVDQARPPSWGYMAFDRALGKIVLVGGRENVGPVETMETWTFDVCTNAWAAMHPASRPDVRAFGMLAYDAAARQTISMSPDSGRVWAYDLASDTWTMRAGAPKTMRAGRPTAPGALRLVYDSVAARVVVLQVGSPRLMWSFDSVAGVWEPVDQDRDVWYPSDSSDLHFLLAYDASVDRLVGYDRGEVRLFDLRTGTWSPPGTRSPSFGYGGYYSFGGEIAYDEAAQRTVLFSIGDVIAYDAAADRWETLYGTAFDQPNACGIRPECRVQPSMVYDPINERLVVYGGNVQTGAEWWGPSDDVLAFDTRTREWTVLLEASEAQPAP
ncbi:MAG: hypothetical protein A2X23_09995 [Chloroflexi bacterium GWC2_73_18]|nr:MAG: hypothetical protein A2X23_09995 [Chloroflexi bacterium GWC2_73_18]